MSLGPICPVPHGAHYLPGASLQKHQGLWGRWGHATAPVTRHRPPVPPQPFPATRHLGERLGMAATQKFQLAPGLFPQNVAASRAESHVAVLPRGVSMTKLASPLRGVDLEGL